LAIRFKTFSALNQRYARDASEKETNGELQEITTAEGYSNKNKQKTCQQIN
jgi:hypothetical protein